MALTCHGVMVVHVRFLPIHLVELSGLVNQVDVCRGLCLYCLQLRPSKGIVGGKGVPALQVLHCCFCFDYHFLGLGSLATYGFAQDLI